MTTAYNQHTFTSITVGPTGHQHGRAPGLADEVPTAIDCDACAPFLAADGWVFDPALVPLTERQIAVREQHDREGNAAVRQAAAALADLAGRAISEAAKPEPAKAAPAPAVPEPARPAEPVKVEAKTDGKRRGPKTKAEKAALAAKSNAAPAADG